MALVPIASGTITVNTLGVSQSLVTVNTPGFFFLDTDVSAGTSGDSVVLQAFNSTLLNGAQTQEDTTGTVTVPQANGNGHIVLGPELCSWTAPGLSMTITVNGTKFAVPWAVFQVA